MFREVDRSTDYSFSLYDARKVSFSFEFVFSLLLSAPNLRDSQFFFRNKSDSSSSKTVINIRKLPQRDIHGKDYGKILVRLKRPCRASGNPKGSR